MQASTILLNLHAQKTSDGAKLDVHGKAIIDSDKRVKWP